MQMQRHASLALIGCMHRIDQAQLCSMQMSSGVQQIMEHDLH
jgi:hypothetical protein